LAMAEHGTEIAAARDRSVAALEATIADTPDDQFARASIVLEGWRATDLAATLRSNRSRDAAAGRATEGPHRQDLGVTHRAKQMPAAQSSTGEQKALLLGLVAAHLDPKRRAALFSRLEGRGQVWMTATEAALFDGIGAASRFHVQPGQILPA